MDASSLPLFISLWLLIVSRAHCVAPLKGIDIGSPSIDVTPYPLSEKSSVHWFHDVLSCERVQVSGYSRMKLGSYPSSFRVTLAPSVVIPERLHHKIQVCFHCNASLGLCQCDKDEWKGIQNGGIWSTVMSPYADRFVDVKFDGRVSGSVSVAVEEDFQRWRLLCLAFGFFTLLLAPVVSSWVPFYYSSSMATGVFLVILIILFQGMKLLPIGRKNVLYLTIYGSVLGAGSFLLHQFSVLVNSILINFGFSEGMHNLVAIFVLVGIVLAGAALGYWIVRKFVISKDGTVDVGVAQFVKWAMRIIASTSIFQSTLDAPLALGALFSCCIFCSLITSPNWVRIWLQGSSQTTKKHECAEFLSRSPVDRSRGKLWSSPKSTKNSPSWPNSLFNGMDQSIEDFDAFFNHLRSGFTSSKGTFPPRAPRTKIKSQRSFRGGFKGTLGTQKRKKGSFFSLPGDFIEGELDPVVNKKDSHLTDCVHYTTENITPEVAAEMDKLGLDESYSRALTTSQDMTFLLSHRPQDLTVIANVQLENEKLKSKLQSCRTNEYKLLRKNKTLKGRLDKVSEKKARMVKDLEELQAKHENLVCQQKDMIDNAFEHIMTEVWSVDPGLVVPSLEKWVDKLAILKVIEDSRAPHTSQFESLWRSSSVPQPGSLLSTLVIEARTSTTSSTFVDPPVLKDESEDDPHAI